MPELPEVETVMRSLRTPLQGRRLTGVVQLDWPKTIGRPRDEFDALIGGRAIAELRRRAKWILIGLGADLTLAVHLRMSGNLLLRDADAALPAHTRAALGLDDGRRLVFDDPRKFGRLLLLDRDELAALEAAHGPEPLEAAFDAARLQAILAGRATPIKALLLDQTRIAGIGNIYASEALWRARIHPLMRAGALTAEQIRALHAAIIEVLEKAIANHGSTLRNYRDSRGVAGSNQEHFWAYDRGGQPCQRCGAPIERLVIGQRSTYFCGDCQRLEHA
jgi:formamidopyrimidine-DNA glycosylase